MTVSGGGGACSFLAGFRDVGFITLRGDATFSLVLFAASGVLFAEIECFVLFFSGLTFANSARLLLFEPGRVGNVFSVRAVFSWPASGVVLWVVPFSSPYFRFAPALTGSDAGSGEGCFVGLASLLGLSGITISPVSFSGSGLLDGCLS
jgi:hypothetical protein